MFAMPSYHRSAFSQAYALVDALRTDNSDFDALRGLQQLILHEVARNERIIRQTKADLKEATAEDAQSAVRRKNLLERRVESSRQCAYICRCFGDAIAYSYLDKHALKHTYFSTESTSVRQGSGFVSDKTGLSVEIELLEDALANGVPAVLSDLTNIIRHGDVCLLGGHDPYPIEVKSSKNVDRRGRQQRRVLKRLHDFYQTDRAENFRGFPEMKRQVITSREKNYIDDFNRCIEDARANGHAICEPEHGVYYLVTVDETADMEELFSVITPGPMWVFSLNEFKFNRCWAPYQPFILTIRREDDLWDFVRGELHVTVMINTEVLVGIAAEYGGRAEIQPDANDYPLSIDFPGVGFLKISRQMLGRIAMEFVSPRWLVGANIEMFKKQTETLTDITNDNGSHV